MAVNKNGIFIDYMDIQSIIEEVFNVSKLDAFYIFEDMEEDELFDSISEGYEIIDLVNIVRNYEI